MNTALDGADRPLERGPSGKRIELAHLEPVATGGVRRIFEHPHDPDLLIKVASPAWLERRSRLREVFHDQAPIARFHRRISHELAAYLALRARGTAPPAFVAPIVGLAETDLGLGLVVVKIRGRDGHLARRLDGLVREQGLSDRMRDHLRIFCQTLVASGTIVNDLRPANIVLGHDGTHGDRLVLVDGFGEKSLVPMSTLSAYACRVNCRRHTRRLMRRVAALTS
jgi:hypothetical protein